MQERDMSGGEDEDDDVFDEDMEALRRACTITGTNPDDLDKASASASAAAGESNSDDDMDDLELVRNIRNRFSISSDVFEPLSLKPLCSLPPAMSDDDDDDDDDFQTLRAIQNRFAAYDNDALKNSMENSLEKQEHVPDSCVSLEKTSNDFSIDRIDGREGFLDSKYICRTTHGLGDNLEMPPSTCVEWHNIDPSEPSTSQSNYSSFPKSAKVFMDAIKKNRSFQKFLRSKLIQIEAKIEENKKLKERVKILRDFQVSCKRRTGRALSQKKDSRAQLISVKKSLPSNHSKANDKKISAMYYGPVENSHVANYRLALTKFPLSLERKRWSDDERINLEKGIRQQFQERMLQIMVDQLSGSGESYGDSNDLDNMLLSIKNLDITSENIREFLPKVNWEQLASMYVAGRSGAECEVRWLNFEDPLINHNPWTGQEDKNLLFLIQKNGISNWFDIAVSLGTNRTPFQCLVRYQRSLNVSILKREWTKDEDEKLRSAVEAFGEGDWQSIASVLEGWTGTQCSNRWKKSLHPTREKIGRWTADEDKRLKVAQLLFGPRNWMKTAQFVPGRTQVQCRERWVNSLDPSLNWDKWTEEEDSKLRAAIAEHGYCWAKIAAAVPRRTDNMCRRRWKKLLPEEVPLLQEARRIQKAALICNFVDRESERPALCPNDFRPVPMITSSKNGNLSKKQNGKLRGGTRKRNFKKFRDNSETGPKEGMVGSNHGEVETYNGHEAIARQGSESSNLTKPRPERKKRSHKPCSKRMELPDPVEERECPQLQPLANRTRASSKRQHRRKLCTANSGETQHSTPSSEKSLLIENATDVEHQHDRTSCLDSTQSMVINGEEIGKLGENDKMGSKKTTFTKKYHRRNKDTEPTGGLKDVVPVPSQCNRLKKVKPRGISCSDQNLGTADDDIPLACFQSKEAKKIKLDDCGNNQACPLALIQESEVFPERATCLDGTTCERLSYCNIKSGRLMDISNVVASDDEPVRPDLVGAQKVACQDLAKGRGCLDVESGHDANNISIGSVVQKESRKKHQTCKTGTPSSLIRGSQLLSKRVNQLHDGNHTASMAGGPDLVTLQEVALDELEHEPDKEPEQVEDENDDAMTLACFLQKKPKKRQLHSTE